jgi:RHS repeat-associated protein
VDGFSYQYDAVGNLIGVDRLSDGSRILYSYDVLHRLIEERWLNTTGETVYTLTIRYDAAGNRVAVTRNGLTTQYTYDDHNRLISEARPLIAPVAAGLPLAVLFSLTGLRRAKRRRFILFGLLVVGLMGTLVLAQTNPLVTTVLYTYDANGNLTSMGYIEPAANTLPNVTPAPRHTLNFEYDEIGRLVRVVGQNEFGEQVDTRWSYHDVTNRPTFWRSEEGDRSELIYDGAALLAMRRMSSEQASIEKYLNLKPNDRLLTIKADGTHLWHLNDAFGAARMFVDDAGNIVDGSAFRLDYNSAGMRIYPYTDNKMPADADLIQLTPLYGGQLYDPSTNLYMLGARVYDPRTARYLQPDPIYQDILGTSYTYAHNRPFMNGAGSEVNPTAPVRPSVGNPMPIRPATLLPTLPQPEIPLPDTALLQREDTFRAWQLLGATRYGINTTVGQLSPLLDTFYLMDTPAMPDAVQALIAQPTHQAMRLYSSAQGWQPDLTPNPEDAVNPFAALAEVEPLLAQASERLWVRTPDDMQTWTPLLPGLPVPNTFPPVQQIERLIPTLAQEIGMVNPHEMQMLTHIQLDNVVSAAPQLIQTGVILPTVNRQPMPAMWLDALRAQQQYLSDQLFD